MSDSKSSMGATTRRPVPHTSDTPPPYSAPTPEATSSRAPVSQSKVPGFPDLPLPQLAQYHPEGASVNSEGTVVTLPVSTNPSALVAFLRTQASLPPFLVMQVVGLSYGRRKDFDVRINLLRYLIWEPTTERPDGAHYLRLHKQRLPQDVQAMMATRECTLKNLAQAYCGDTSTNKSLTLERSVTNLDESILAARVAHCLAELKYKGDVQITFPIRNQTIRLVPNNTPLDKFVGWFAKPRDYAAIEAVWPFATAPPPEPSRSEGSNHQRTFAVRSEEGLWHDWRPAFERAVLSGRDGYVGLDDLLEARMGIPGPKRKAHEWGSMSGTGE